jgi:hypothetical protein
MLFCVKGKKTMIVGPWTAMVGIDETEGLGTR